MQKIHRRYVEYIEKIYRKDIYIEERHRRNDDRYTELDTI